jgi:hypothetical protein
MRLSRVQIIRKVTTSPAPGTFVSGEEIIATSFMQIAPASANAIYTATLREQNVTHQAYARANAKWQGAEIGDIIGYGDRRLKIITKRDAGEIDSAWIYFELDEQSLKEVSTDE